MGQTREIERYQVCRTLQQDGSKWYACERCEQTMAYSEGCIWGEMKMERRGVPAFFSILPLYVLFETNHVDEANTVKPHGDAAHNALGILPILNGLEGGIVNNFKVF